MEQSYVECCSKIPREKSIKSLNDNNVHQTKIFSQ